MEEARTDFEMEHGDPAVHCDLNVQGVHKDLKTASQRDSDFQGSSSVTAVELVVRCCFLFAHALQPVHRGMEPAFHRDSDFGSSVIAVELVVDLKIQAVHEDLQTAAQRASDFGGSSSVTVVELVVQCRFLFAYSDNLFDLDEFDPGLVRLDTFQLVRLLEADVLVHSESFGKFSFPHEHSERPNVFAQNLPHPVALSAP